MPQTFVMPRQIALSSSNQLLSGALLYFYQTATTTPQAVFSDAALTVELSNPVVADASGQFPKIYYNANATADYRVRHTTAAGTLLYQEDDISRYPVSAAEIGAAFYPITASEQVALVTPTDTKIASHTQIGYVNPARYGFLTTATGTANYAALVKANAVATAAGCPITISQGIYDYAPTAVMLLSRGLMGNGGFATFRCDSGYAGVYFQMFDSQIMEKVQAFTTARTKIGTFLRQMAVNTAEFTGWQTVRDVWLFGFAKGFDVGNTFLMTWDRCRSEECTTGFYCVPDSSGGNGYVTTHQHINCSYFGSNQDVLYTSAIQSRGVQFLMGGIEQPSTFTAQFTRVRGLEFAGSYFEGSNTIAAITLNDCSASIRGQGYFNGTAGIALGTNTEITIQDFRAGTATDVLTGGDGTQRVTLVDCDFPGSGNSTSFARWVMVNTSYNGVFYDLFAKNNDTAFTPTARGTSVAGTPTYDIQNGYVARIGSQVVVRGTVSITAKTGMTGNLQIGGLPFTSSNQANGHTLVPISCNGLTNSAGYTQFVGRIQPNSSVIDIIELGSNQSSSLVPIANVSATAIIQFTATYSPT